MDVTGSSDQLELVLKIDLDHFVTVHIEHETVSTSRKYSCEDLFDAHPIRFPYQTKISLSLFAFLIQRMMSRQILSYRYEEK